MSDNLPNLAPQGGAALAPAPGTNAAFTDAQVDEYREQDRWLPVSGRDREATCCDRCYRPDAPSM
jgi:hypothetical protein